jgi:hypothetical protein
LFYKTGLMPRPEYKVKKKEAAPQGGTAEAPKAATKAKAEPAPAKPPETPKPEAKAATKEK